MAKSSEAFRTISEVSDWLDTPAHVLRFWESRFNQIKPVKRAGGRRYYRPSDMALLGGIKRLLHDDGLTIKGVQKILREKGVKYVGSLSLGPANDGHQEDRADPSLETTPIDSLLSDDVAATETQTADPNEIYVEQSISPTKTETADNRPADAPEIELDADTTAADQGADVTSTILAAARTSRQTVEEQAQAETSSATPNMAELYQRLVKLRNRLHDDMSRG